MALAHGAMDFFKNLPQAVTKLPVRIVFLEFSHIADPPNVVADAIVLFVFPG